MRDLIIQIERRARVDHGGDFDQSGQGVFSGPPRILPGVYGRSLRR